LCNSRIDRNSLVQIFESTIHVLTLQAEHTAIRIDDFHAATGGSEFNDLVVVGQDTSPISLFLPESCAQIKRINVVRVHLERLIYVGQGRVCVATLKVTHCALQIILGGLWGLRVCGAHKEEN